jgi:hypothetical protein
MKGFGIDVSRWPKVAAYMRRIEVRPLSLGDAGKGSSSPGSSVNNLLVGTRGRRDTRQPRQFAERGGVAGGDPDRVVPL